MKLYRYWARVDVDREGRPVEGAGEAITGASGWSNESVEAARRDAMQRAEQFARWIREEPARLLDWYEYAVRPVREPILEEVHHAGQRVAALTRNAYGTEVLNAASLFIADIDPPKQTTAGGLGALWGRLMGRKQSTPEDAVRERLEKLMTENRRLGARLYRTRAGHRAIITSWPIAPTSDEARNLLQALGSDPIYMRLCEHQECYRARLTPKPWRIGLQAMNVGRFPRPENDVHRQQAADDWLEEYETAAQEWTVCELVETFGDAAVHRDLQPVLELHDARACEAGKPLA